MTILINWLHAGDCLTILATILLNQINYNPKDCHGTILHFFPLENKMEKKICLDLLY